MTEPKASSAIEREHNRRERIADALKSIRGLVLPLTKIAERSLNPNSLEDVIAWFSNEPVFNVRCVEPVIENGVYKPSPESTAAKGKQHRIKMYSDGTVEFSHHKPATDDHLAAVMVLGSLGSYVSGCEVIAATVAKGRPFPTFAKEVLGTNLDDLRRVFTAWRWVQYGRVSLVDVAPLLTHGVDPDVWKKWENRGWTFDEARPFLAAGAELHIAELWKASGRTGVQVARLAAKERTPTNVDSFRELGFTEKQALSWQSQTKLSATEAKSMALLGFEPVDFSDKGRPKPIVYSRQNYQPLTEEKKVEWAKAGVPGAQVSDFWHATDHDLSFALYWVQAGLSGKHAVEANNAWSIGNKVGNSIVDTATGWKKVVPDFDPLTMLIVMQGPVTLGNYTEWYESLSHDEKSVINSKLVYDRIKECMKWWNEQSDS